MVVAAATKEGWILLTFDLEVADIRRHPSGTDAEIVVFRLRDQRGKTLEKPARRLLESGGLQTLDRGLAIVDETRVRSKWP
jgi:hypothetical protein